MNNLSSYCGLVGAKLRASEKDLLVIDSICEIITVAGGWPGRLARRLPNQLMQLALAFPNSPYKQESTSGRSKGSMPV